MPPKKKTTKKKIIKKKVVKIKPVFKKKPAAKKKPAKKPAKKTNKNKENIIGVITHYFPHVRAAVIKLKAPLSVGDRIKIKGHTTDFSQTIDSIQMDREPITSGKKGQEIGLLVDSRVRQHDKVIKESPKK